MTSDNDSNEVISPFDVFLSEYFMLICANNFIVPNGFGDTDSNSLLSLYVLRLRYAVALTMFDH